MERRVQAGMLLRLVVLLCFGAASASGQVAIPSTPAGRTFQVWLDAMNSGDRAKMESYVRTSDPKLTADSMMAFHNQTGGFELLAIESSEPLLIRFRVKEKTSATIAIGSMQVKQAEPPTVENFGLRAIPPGAVIENVRLDAASRSQVLDGVVTNLNEFYVYPDGAKKMEEGLRSRQRRGEYDAVTDGDAFAALLTSQLQEVSHDKHLRVNYSPFQLPVEKHGSSPEDEARFRKQMERSNCGFERVEVLPRNIGYVKFNEFDEASICGPTAIAAMNFLAHVDAVIFDLRDNGGGDPSMVALIATYLFAKPTHLNDLYNRKEDSTQESWTLPSVPGTRLTEQPVFVLTSSRTFSGAEEFSYDLKNLKRATIVGETTGGGAHPVSGHRVNDHFMIGVPFARAVNPISKTNWEGMGVEPDVRVPTSEALETAKKLAATKLSAH